MVCGSETSGVQEGGRIQKTSPNSVVPKRGIGSQVPAAEFLSVQYKIRNLSEDVPGGRSYG